MAKLKVGQKVILKSTGQTGKVLMIDKVNGTALVDIDGEITRFSQDLLLIISTLRSIWMIFRSFFK
jgi:hypothetical protein